MKYEEILQKATAAAEDRKLSGSIKYKVITKLCLSSLVIPTSSWELTSPLVTYHRWGNRVGTVVRASTSDR